MVEKIKGTVKWFSNRKGFGFITPSSDNSPTKEDIFVHQSNIITDAEYRSLKDGMEVQFEAVKDDQDKLKAQNVTLADGSPCPGPEPREKRQRNRKQKSEDGGGDPGAKAGDNETGGEDGNKNGQGPGDENKEGAGNKSKKNRRRNRNKNGKKSEGGDGTADGGEAKPKLPPKPTWYSELNDDVKKSMKDRNIKINGGRAFVTIGDARVKIGTTGYCAMAHKNGVIAEGTYECSHEGIVKPTWSKVLKFDGGEWKPSDTTEQTNLLVGDINLTGESVKATGIDEKIESLWGDDKADPKDALEANGFLMRTVTLHATPGRRGRGYRGRHGGANKNGKKPANGGGETAPAATEAKPE